MHDSHNDDHDKESGVASPMPSNADIALMSRLRGASSSSDPIAFIQATPEAVLAEATQLKSVTKAELDNKGGELPSTMVATLDDAEVERVALQRAFGSEPLDVHQQLGGGGSDDDADGAKDVGTDGNRKLKEKAKEKIQKKEKAKEKIQKNTKKPKSPSGSCKSAYHTFIGKMMLEFKDLGRTPRQNLTAAAQAWSARPEAKAKAEKAKAEKVAPKAKAKAEKVAPKAKATKAEEETLAVGKFGCSKCRHQPSGCLMCSRQKAEKHKAKCAGKVKGETSKGKGKKQEAQEQPGEQEAQEQPGEQKELAEDVD